MAYAKLAALAVLVVILLHASTRAMAARPSLKFDELQAVMTLNDFEPGKGSSGPSECDGHYHNNNEMLVALSTGLYAGGRRCQKMISITSQ